MAENLIGDIFFVGTPTKYFKVDANGVPSSLSTGATSTYSVASSEVVRYTILAASAVVASTTGVHAAVTDTGADVTVTTSITNPAVARNITATAGGTAGDIKAIQVIVTGTNMNDEVISETLPAFTVNTAGSVTGAKIFKTVTSFVIPAHDGTGATTALGFGNKFGLPDKLALNTVSRAFLDSVVEGTAPTVTVSSSALESNGFTLNSTPNGTQIDVLYSRT